MKTTPTSHLVGFTRYKRKRMCPPMSSTAGNNHGRSANLVSYCPECPWLHAADPEKSVHVNVSMRAKVGRCVNGHRWRII